MTLVLWTIAAAGVSLLISIVVGHVVDRVLKRFDAEQA